MGYFKKKLLVVSLLSLFIVFFVSSSVNASLNTTYYSIDVPNLLKDQQEYLASTFIKRMYQINNANFITDFEDFIQRDGYWYLFSYSVINSQSYFVCYLLPNTISYEQLNQYTLDTDDAYFEDTYFLYPISGYSIQASDFGWGGIRRYIIQVGGTSTTVNTGYAGKFFVPSCLILYQNQVVSNLRAGIKPTDNVWTTLFSAIHENTEETEDVKDELKKLNDFMSSDNVDSDTYDMPGNNDNPTQDITEQGVNNIFDMFYQKIINWDSALIRIEIPFTNKYFDIRPNLTENIVANFPNGAFKNLLGLVWYYLLGVYVVKDVQKYIDGLQTGEILTKSDTNIKTDML